MADKKLPSVSRAVHYTSEDNGPCRAATVTEVRDENTVDLEVHHPAELRYRNGVPHSDEYKAGTWHWPELV